MFPYTSGAITDRGDVRTENQDSILLMEGEVADQPAALYLVADGMGGLSYGAQVSRYITEQFRRWWQEDFPQLIHAGMEGEEEIRELLEQEIWDINQAVLDFKNRMQCRSGSTLSLLLLYKDRYYIENIGDSRVYLARGGKMEQLTSDQSLAARMVRECLMTEEEAQHSRTQHVLTMCIGMFPVPQSGYVSGKLLPGDCFLLCSDGFYHPLELGRLHHVLTDRDLTAGEKVDCLRRRIGPGSAKDNVSAIVVDVAGKNSRRILRGWGGTIC